MRFQQKSGWCGPAAIQNAFRLLGNRISQKRIAAAAATTVENGTDESGMINAIRTFGFVANKYETSDPVAAWAWVLDCLHNERPVILCTLNWRHWVTAGGLIGNRVMVIDPTTEKFNLEENGVTAQCKKDFMKRWIEKSSGIYWGISVGKK